MSGPLADATLAFTDYKSVPPSQVPVFSKGLGSGSQAGTSRQSAQVTEGRIKLEQKFAVCDFSLISEYHFAAASLSSADNMAVWVQL